MMFNFKLIAELEVFKEVFTVLADIAVAVEV